MYNWICLIADKTDEGELHWVPESQLLERAYTATFQAMLAHYLATSEERVVIGTAENEGGRCRMVWAALEDFEKSEENIWKGC